MNQSSPNGHWVLDDAERETRLQPVCLPDFERMAAGRLSSEVRDFVAGGSGDESTQVANRAALDRMRLAPRVLATVDPPNCTVWLLRTAAAMPVAVAPMAYQRLVHPEGELGMARAAKVAGVPFVISTLSSSSIEEISATGAAIWFQLYWLRDRGRVVDLVRRAEAAGCEALMITVDVPVMGRRLRDIRNGFALPDSVAAANFAGGHATEAHLRKEGESAIAVHTSKAFNPGLQWDDLEWLRGNTELPLVVKGIMDPRDAILAANIGVDAVVVSNHGGRQFAGATPSITALSAVVESVGDQCEVLLDSGVRSGTDIVRALALGASGVLVGRPLLWGLAVGGEQGANAVLLLLQNELHEALQLAGCATPKAAADLRVTFLP